ncbi:MULTISPECIES: hypothetical protein [unclassified Streptomyces]|uniref:hypothetical protein n=1 Tax=unclassified Streptomyces TaxID=2593676 RepID=UPI000DAF21D5|nr:MULTISPECIES: hypothetical protein [unclassified Streptomyces]PZT76344.1 hypothetical protein DNK56_23655 [Streptomyces sp. AC1-42W]PZT79702.1 hypothetical protein DNK55_09030 [Streptomyces sp. AC1-42T]WUC95638.1 hypothetical protein OG710_19460 [Streptomyces sp. NBC_00525]
MRKLGMSIAALGLAAAGLVVPATAAQASAQSSASAAASNHCNDIWPGRNGNMYAYDSTYCYNKLGSAAGNDANWDTAGGGFENDSDKASSVMNAGYTGDLDVVKFFWLQNYEGGYNCLAPGEFFVDDLSRNTFSNGYTMNNNIRSHKWVNDCSRWMH